MSPHFNPSKITRKKLDNMKEQPLQELVLQILERIEGIDPVKLWHGSQEFGVDIYFVANDAVRGVNHFGAQIKAGNIKKSRNRVSKDLKVIMAQILMAYSHKFPSLTDPRDDVSLAGFYLITNGEISPEARETIKEVSKYCQNIHFIDGDNLWQIILTLREGATRESKGSQK